jgi:hypothetical protein
MISAGIVLIVDYFGSTKNNQVDINKRMEEVREAKKIKNELKNETEISNSQNKEGS